LDVKKLTIPILELMATKSIYSKIVGHQGPLKPNDPAYLGSSYNVMPLWDDGTTTWEPLNSMLQYDLITMVAYAKENGLLDTPGWKKCKKIARRAKVLRRMVNVTKRSSKFHEISYKFGVRLPRNYDLMRRMETRNGSTPLAVNVDKSTSTSVSTVSAGRKLRFLLATSRSNSDGYLM
jgi:hypothetical protein